MVTRLTSLGPQLPGQLLVGGAFRTSGACPGGVSSGLASTLQDTRAPSRAGPPGGAQLRLPHEIAGQLLAQLNAAPQCRLTESAVQQNLVGLTDSEVIAEEAEMLLGVFLPRDLHAWLTGTEATGPERRRNTNLPVHRRRDRLIPERKFPWPRKQTPPPPGPALW